MGEITQIQLPVEGVTTAEPFGQTVPEADKISSVRTFLRRHKSFINIWYYTN